LLPVIPTRGQKGFKRIEKAGIESGVESSDLSESVHNFNGLRVLPICFDSVKASLPSPSVIRRGVGTAS
jgi:hypothetical protein